MVMIKRFKAILRLLSVVMLLGLARGFTVEDETALRNELMTNYSREVRPDAVTEVSLQMHVTSINNVDIRNEVFSLSGWWSMVWEDSRLNWTGKYRNIPVVQFNEDRIWSPVLVVSNSIKDLTAIDEDSIPLRVDSNGRVLWNPPALLEVSCSMDVKYFPFDVQKCSIEVTSFGYTIQELNVKVYSDGLSFRYYDPSGEWDIIKTSTSRGEYSEDGYTYARVTFDLELERKPLYYGINMILPVFVNSALTLFVFLLPPESGEKIGYCLTVLLAFMVILTLVATDLPTTATTTPLLEIYIAMVLVLGGLSVILAIIVLHIFFLPEEKPVPAWMARACLLSSRVCCISRVEVNKVDDRGNGRTPRDSFAVSTSDVNPKHPDNEMTDFSHHNQQQHTAKLSRRRSTLQNIDPGRAPKHEADVTWQMVATIIDGVCLRFYAVFLIISTIVILAMLVS